MVDALNTALEVFCRYRENSFGEVLANALQSIAEAMCIDRILISRQIGTTKKPRLKQLYIWNRPDGAPREGAAFAVDNQAPPEWLGLLLEDQCINRNISDASPDEAAYMRSVCVKSVFIVPIFTRENFWGCVMFHDSVNTYYYDENCVDMIQSFARLCASAVIRDEMARELAEQNETTSVMFTAAPIGLVMFDDNCNLIDCNEAVLAMLGVTREHYLNRFYTMAPKYQPNGSVSQDMALENMRRALDGETVVMEWMYYSATGEAIPTEVTFTRVFHKEKNVGLCYIYDLRTIKKMERNIIQLKSESEKIYYDPLTGIFNRRFFDENLDRVIKTLSRSGGVLSLMMIDVDAFKQYNDTYGHSAGDACLRAIANCLSKSVTRADDFVVRYGGDEFAVVLPNTDEDGARLLAEKMLENVLQCSIQNGKNGLTGPITISIGGTTGKVKTTYRADDYIKRADELLYASKQIGRNRATFGGMEPNIFKFT